MMGDIVIDSGTIAPSLCRRSVWNPLTVLPSPIWANKEKQFLGPVRRDEHGNVTPDHFRSLVAAESLGSSRFTTRPSSVLPMMASSDDLTRAARKGSTRN